MDGDDIDQNYDDGDIVPETHPSVAPHPAPFMPLQSPPGMPQPALHQPSLFRPSPLATLIQQQQQQQIPASHFLPLGSKPIPPPLGGAPISAQPSSSISAAEAAAIAEEGLDARFEEEKALLELLSQLESFTPIVPDAIMDIIMTRAGVDASDVKIKRLLALMAQKFITDVAQDALQYSRIRTGTGGTSKSSGAERRAKDKRFMLAVEDLNAALQDHGVVTRRPPYFR